MKKISIPNLIILVAFISFLMTGCGGKGGDSVEDILESKDMEKAKELKTSLAKEQTALGKKIAKLDSLIKVQSGDKNLPLVTTFIAEKKAFNHFIELQGDVTTKQNVLIYPEAPGTLQRVYVKEGQRVSKGQLLASIDNGGLANQLAQMKTQLNLAKITFERQSNLWLKDSIGTEIQYLSSKTSYEAQKDAIKQMERQLDKYSVRAPFSGIIDDVIKDQGTVVAPGPGSEIFRIINLSDMYVEVDVPESYISSVSKGRKVQVYFPILDKTVESYIRQTGNYINPNNRSFTIEIPVDNKDGNIKPNLTAKVMINDYINEEAILIPQSVISENAEGDQYTYVAENVQKDKTANAKRNIVTTGKTQGDYVEVLSGISEGQNIIKEGARSVKEGQKVKILTE
ncbi:MAG: efflux RND transporter periplasmic adaptor subunit [Cyclobacteriaceae bacterium]